MNQIPDVLVIMKYVNMHLKTSQESYETAETRNPYYCIICFLGINLILDIQWTKKTDTQLICSVHSAQLIVQKDDNEMQCVNIRVRVSGHTIHYCLHRLEIAQQ